MDAAQVEGRLAVLGHDLDLFVDVDLVGDEALKELLLVHLDPDRSGVQRDVDEHFLGGLDGLDQIHVCVSVLHIPVIPRFNKKGNRNKTERKEGVSQPSQLTPWNQCLK